MNYADLYRVADGQVVIRYFFDHSIDRLSVEDDQGHSYALNTLIRDQLREGLIRWADAAEHRFIVEEAHSADQANLVIYGNSTYWEYGLMTRGVPPGPPLPPIFPRPPGVGTIYVMGRGVQQFLNAFLDPNSNYSQKYRRFTGINNVTDYLRSLMLWSLFHESGHILGFGHPDVVSPPYEGYTVRPIVEDLPSPIPRRTQMMRSLDTGYLESRYQELGRPVHINDISVSPQERWAMLSLWNQRNRTLHCQPRPSSAMLLSASVNDGCLTALPGPTLPSIGWLLIN